MPIEKRQLDPKTFELYNTDRFSEPGLPSNQAIQELGGKDQVQARMFEEMQAQAKGLPGMEPAYNDEPITPKQRREYRQQFRLFDQYMKKGGTDVASGIQELVESGAMWMDANGEVYSAVPLHGERQRQRLNEAAGIWNDFQMDLQRDFPEQDVPPEVVQDRLKELERFLQARKIEKLINKAP